MTEDAKRRRRPRRKPKPPWDPQMANDAAVADQCMKLGAVVLRPPRQTGFSADYQVIERPPEQP